MKQLLAVIPFVFVLGACTHGNCRTQKQPDKAAATATNATTSEAPVTKSAATDRVKVHKPDGSLQCGQGKAIPVAEMQKQLKGIKVYSSSNQNDGMMRIQVCGSPTGMSNVYEIDRKDLEAALKLGFKEWTLE
ncbi:hypothetical protein AZI87_12050 [Bdellovibrio bacteriovorus]|uniref:Lipoprotein n=1 Tax=Bdellovibrio bacteriovorus TaxID=959 RepID=A0A162G8H4_BDEBC|nr:hypothetical protein [Bdellovibrio bacteriovorus]KYG65281.1 hypothetical protein AZI87_12050 [Bdellovibrio bacteriovorus]